MDGNVTDSAWNEMIADYYEFCNLPKEEKQRRTDGEVIGNEFSFSITSVAMMAFSVVFKKDGN